MKKGKSKFSDFLKYRGNIFYDKIREIDINEDSLLSLKESYLKEFVTENLEKHEKKELLKSIITIANVYISSEQNNKIFNLALGFFISIITFIITSSANSLIVTSGGWFISGLFIIAAIFYILETKFKNRLMKLTLLKRFAQDELENL